MNPVSRIVFVLAIAAGSASAQTQPPIRMIFDIHMDPFAQIPPDPRHEIYLRWIADTHWALDQVESLGVQISFNSVGEFMEYVWEEGSDGPGAVLLRRLYSMGGVIGSHSHQEYQRGRHDWPSFGPDADLDDARRSWRDNVDWVNAAILVALGDPPPEPLDVINNVKGSHLPKNEPDYHTLMEEFDITVRQSGPEEDYYGWFNHHIWHPFRPSTDNDMGEDLDASFVAIPSGPVIGKSGIHHGTLQDMTAPNVKRLFLQCYLNWRHDDRHGRDEKIWNFGWGSHGSDWNAGGESREALVDVVAWLEEEFVGTTEPSGSEVMQWSTYYESAEAYEDWEARNPGTSSFSFDSLSVNWSEYPWLRAVAEELQLCHYVEAVDLGDGIRAYRLERDEDEMILAWHPTSTSVEDFSGLLSTPARVVELESGMLVDTEIDAVDVGPEPVLVTEYVPHLTQSGEPRLGEALIVDVHGREGEIASLWVSSAALDAPVPHMGRLLLDPSAGFLRVAAGFIPPSGFLRVIMPIPEDDAFLGLTAHFQGLVTRFQGAGALLTTNAVVETIVE